MKQLLLLICVFLLFIAPFVRGSYSARWLWSVAAGSCVRRLGQMVCSSSPGIAFHLSLSLSRWLSISFRLSSVSRSFSVPDALALYL